MVGDVSRPCEPGRRHLKSMDNGGGSRRQTQAEEEEEKFALKIDDDDDDDIGEVGYIVKCPP